MNNIKFAVATDNSAEPSYYCKDNKFYRSETNQDVTTTDLPYSAFWTYPALFDGHFINLILFYFLKIILNMFFQIL